MVFLTPKRLIVSDICFIPDGNYRDFDAKEIDKNASALGDIVNLEGEIMEKAPRNGQCTQSAKERVLVVGGSEGEA